MGRWETGRTRLYWSDFLAVTDACGDSLQHRLLNATSRPMNDVGSAKVVQWIIGETTLSDVCERTAIGRRKLDRWLSEETSPTLDDVIALADGLNHYLFDFLVDLIDPERFAMDQDLQGYFQYKDQVAKSPLTSLVRMLVSHKDYQRLPKHEPGFFAKKLGISLAEENRQIDAMCRFKVIELIDGKYRIPEAAVIRCTRIWSSFNDYADVISHWLQEANDCIQAQKPKGADINISNMSYVVAAVDIETFNAIQQRYRDFFAEVSTLVKEAPPDQKDQIFVAATQIFDPLFSRGNEGTKAFDGGEPFDFEREHVFS